MARLSLLVAALFFGMTTLPYSAVESLSIKPAPQLTCSYTGDPHLIPFSQPYAQYWCQKSGWELLLSNQYVTLYVLVSQAPYTILDYKLIFPEQTSCNTVASSSTPIPCPNAVPVSSFATGSSYNYYHQQQSLSIRIDYSYPNHHIYIWQSSALVEQSCGVCVKWRCSLESAAPKPNPVIKQLCDVVVEAAQNNPVGPINEKIIDLAKTSCVFDVQTTFQVQNALPTIGLVILDGIKDLLEREDKQSVFEKVELAKQNAVKQAIDQANAILDKAGSVCNGQNQCLEPLVIDKIKGK